MASVKAGEDARRSRISRASGSSVGRHAGGGGGGGGGSSTAAGIGDDNGPSRSVTCGGRGAIGGLACFAGAASVTSAARPLTPLHLHSGRRSLAMPLATSTAGRE